jgi:hypothetical protein
MIRSANEVMQEIVYAAIVDALTALKAASKGVPNTLLRDINAIHANSTFADLPPELQAAITASVRSAFTRLLKEGYSVTSGHAPPPVRREPHIPSRGPRPPQRGGPRRDGPGGPRRDGPGGPRRDGPAGPRPPRGGGGRPGGGGKPGGK